MKTFIVMGVSVDLPNTVEHVQTVITPADLPPGDYVLTLKEWIRENSTTVSVYLEAEPRVKPRDELFILLAEQVAATSHLNERKIDRGLGSFEPWERFKALLDLTHHVGILQVEEALRRMLDQPTTDDSVEDDGTIVKSIPPGWVKCGSDGPCPEAGLWGARGERAAFQRPHVWHQEQWSVAGPKSGYVIHWVGSDTEELSPQFPRPDDGGLRELLSDALTTDGAHHKQWYLEQLAETLGIQVPEHDEGIAP